jgi:hypothetical protein
MIAATLLVASRDWRLNVFALAAQYFFLTLLMTRVVRVEMAAVKGLIGWVICLVFYMTEQQAHAIGEAAAPSDELSLGRWVGARVHLWRHQGISSQAAFSFLAAVLVGVAIYAGAPSVPLPQLPAGLSLVCYHMAGLGILLLGLSQDPLRVGVGLLTVLSGFDLFYVALEPSLVVTGLLGSISFVVALGTAYLKAAQAIRGEEGAA